MTEQFERVSVTNRNDFAISDRCDGVIYEFPSGQRTVIPADVARHLFLYPADEMDMYQHMARRWGWNRPEHYKFEHKGKAIEVPLWLYMCRKVEIRVEKYELRRVREPDAPIPAEEAADAPEMLELNDDSPRRASVGRRRVRVAKRKLSPRVQRPERIDLLARDQPRTVPHPQPSAADLVMPKPEHE